MADVNKTIFWDGLPSSVKLTLVQLLYVSVVGFVGLVLMLTFVQRFHNAKYSIKLSPQLKIHLASWSVFMACPVIYSLPTIIGWKGQDTEYSLLFTCIKGSLNSGALTLAPISTIFLTTDRVFILLFPTRRRSLIWLQITSIVLIIVGFVIVFVDRFRFSYFSNIDISPTTKCISFSCLTVSQVLWRNVKAVLGWINFLLGLYFIYIYYLYQKQANVRREKRKCLLVIWILFSELIFNILPVTISFDSYGNFAFSSSVSSAFGSILTPAHVTDGFAQAVIFWVTWKDRLNARSNINTVIPQAATMHYTSSNTSI